MRGLWWVMLAWGCTGASPSVVEPPDLVIRGLVDGRLQTLAVRDGRVAEASDAVMMAASQGDVAVVEVDRVTAGFVDAHGHPAGLGRRLSELDLTGIASYQEVLDRVGQAAAGAAPGSWIVGRGWDQNDWPDAPASGWPDLRDLDRIAGGRPARLRRVDGHAAWVNTAAMDRALPDGWTELPNVSGGRVVRHEGRFVGVLVDDAMSLVPAPPVTQVEVDRRVKVAMDALAESGLVGVHAMGVSDQALHSMQTMDAAGELPLVISAYLVPESSATERLLAEGPWRGERLSVVGVKAFADGALGSRGAHLSEDYSDEVGHRGTVLMPKDEIAVLATRCLEVGAQLAVHAIGDQAVTDVLDAFEEARTAVPRAESVPLRVEHVQVVRPEDLTRFASLNVVASMQPVHATSDMPWAEQRLGPDRLKWAYAWRTMLDSGATLAFGSDFPVEEVNLTSWMRAATTRTDASGLPEGGWSPGQVLMEDQAIAAFTEGPARALGQEPGGFPSIGEKAMFTLWKIQDGEWIPVGSVIDGVHREFSLE